MHNVDPFTITFAVPHDGAVETVSIESSMTWNDFRHEIAEKIDVATKYLSLSYRLNSEPQKAPFRHLSTPVHYLELVDAVREELEGRATKSSKAKSKTKALVVELKDLRPVDNKGKGKGKSKGKGGKKSVDERYNKVVRQILPLSANRSSFAVLVLTTLSSPMMMDLTLMMKMSLRRLCLQRSALVLSGSRRSWPTFQRAASIQDVSASRKVTITTHLTPIRLQPGKHILCVVHIILVCYNLTYRSSLYRQTVIRPRQCLLAILAL